MTPSRSSGGGPSPGEVDAQRQVGAARLRACLDHPYLASALYAVSIVVTDATPRSPGVSVDEGWRGYVHPELAVESPVDELATRLLHAVSHLVRDHARRVAAVPADVPAGAELVNLAQDCEINDDLAADHLALPPGSPLPQHVGWAPGRAFESYLAEAAELSVLGEDGTEEATDCGPGAHGQAREWATATDDEPLSPTEADLVRRRVANAVREQDRRTGMVPGGWRRWADGLLDPVVDWRTVLSGAVRATLATAAGAVDYTYRRPSRRASAAGRVVLPALHRPAPAVAVVIDTSGSMGSEALGQALAEVQGVLAHAGARRDALRVLCCDAAVAWAGRVTSVDAVPLTGGGGTELGRGIEAAVEGRPRPDVVVVLTDGHTEWPAAPPAVPVVVGLVAGAGQHPPAWATVVDIHR